MQKEGGAGKNNPLVPPPPRPRPRPRPPISLFKASYNIFYGNKQPCRFRVIVKCLTLKEICRLF